MKTVYYKTGSSRLTKKTLDQPSYDKDGKMVLAAPDIPEGTEEISEKEYFSEIEAREKMAADFGFQKK